MITIVPKWQVTFFFTDDETLKIYLSDFHAGNVLRKAAEIDFGIERPVQRVEIARMEALPPSAARYQVATVTPPVPSIPAPAPKSPREMTISCNIDNCFSCGN